MNMPRAGDEVLAVDWEVAVELAFLAEGEENANAVLRRLLDLPPAQNARNTCWRQNTLSKYQNRYAHTSRRGE